MKIIEISNPEFVEIKKDGAISFKGIDTVSKEEIIANVSITQDGMQNLIMQMSMASQQAQAGFEENVVEEPTEGTDAAGSFQNPE